MSRSDTSGESGSRGNNGSSLLNIDPATGLDRDAAGQKYSCARCGRSYLHQVIKATRHLRHTHATFCIVYTGSIASDRNNVFKQNIRGIVQSKISKLGKRRYATKTFYSEFIFSYG